MPVSLSCPIQFPLCLKFSENTLFEIISSLKLSVLCVYTVIPILYM